MATATNTVHVVVPIQPSAAIPIKKKISWSNLLVGAGMNVFQVSTLGQPMENMKTYVRNNDAILI
jgi:hypothetical protein